MDRADPAWFRIGRPRSVDVGLERHGHGVIGGRVGPRSPRRRHRAGSKLRDHFFPHLRIGDRVGDVRTVERKSGCAEFLVMAGDAVLVQDRPGRSGPRGRRRAGGSRRRLRLPRRRLNGG